MRNFLIYFSASSQHEFSKAALVDSSWRGMKLLIRGTHTFVFSVSVLHRWGFTTVISLLLQAGDVQRQTANVHEQRGRTWHPAFREDERAEDAWANGSHGAGPQSRGVAQVSWNNTHFVDSKFSCLFLFRSFKMRRIFSFVEGVKLLNKNDGSVSVSACCESAKRGRICSGSARGWRWKDKNWRGSAWRERGSREKEYALSRYSEQE